MRRVAQDSEFRSNVHRGGRTEKIDLDPAYADVAVRAAQIMNLQVAGVDLLESSSGPQIIEVNSSPGLEGIETTTQLDVAGAIVDFVNEHVKFPELDIRQRLTVSRGWGVSELQVPAGSEFVGRTIGESLRARDIVVMTLHRAGTVIPNPREGRTLEAGDRLLCFGKKESMKDLVPERRREMRRRKVKKLETAVKPTSGEG
jgi:ribosomal protein S6--L-glutamate ligase